MGKRVYSIILIMWFCCTFLVYYVMNSLRQRKMKMQPLCTLHWMIPQLRTATVKCSLLSDLFTEMCISVNRTGGNWYSRIKNYISSWVSIIKWKCWKVNLRTKLLKSAKNYVTFRLFLLDRILNMYKEQSIELPWWYFQDEWKPSEHLTTFKMSLWQSM